MRVTAKSNRFLRALRLVLLATIAGAVAAAADRPPNFIIIYADDLGYGDLGVYGHPSIRTPNIDRMAAEGVRMTEFYSTAPTCSPARAALLTGRYPLRSGLVRVLVPKEKWGIPASEVTLAEALKERGYSTAIVGKWHLGGRRPFRPLRHGFDYFYGVLHSNDMSLLPVVQWPRIALFENNTAIESPAKVRTLTRPCAPRRTSRVNRSTASTVTSSKSWTGVPARY
jgi:arylsulfatase A-like enzyme